MVEMSDQLRTGLPAIDSVMETTSSRQSMPGAASLRPVRTQTRDSAVLDHLTEFIAASGYQPGARLPAERELAERLQVSRSTIREALKRWEALGVVDMRKGSGTYLRAPVDRDAIHLPLTIQRQRDSLLRTLDIRRALEAEAAALVAIKAGDAEIAGIEAKLDRMEVVHRKFGSAPQEDWEFHLSIYDATGNPLFGQIVATLYEAFHDFFSYPFGQRDFASRSFHLHRELFEAIKARNPDAARRKTLAILEIVEQDVQAGPNVDAR